MMAPFPKFFSIFFRALSSAAFRSSATSFTPFYQIHVSIISVFGLKTKHFTNLRSNFCPVIGGRALKGPRPRFVGESLGDPSAYLRSEEQRLNSSHVSI